MLKIKIIDFRVQEAQCLHAETVHKSANMEMLKVDALLQLMDNDRFFKRIFIVFYYANYDA